jgi:inosine-uridine nucleoside N-ribohydrolase
MRTWFGVLWAILLSAVTCSPGFAEGRAVQPTRVIFDTDMYTDMDDMLALAMLNTLQDRGEVELLAVTICTEAGWVPSYVDLINTFYQHDHIPIGMLRTRQGQGSCPSVSEKINYTQYIAELRATNGSVLYPRRLRAGDRVEEAVHLLRRSLVAQPDDSVVMIQVGSSSNFARLLESGPDGISNLTGRELIKQKVRLLSTMAGCFGDGEFLGKPFTPERPETNVVMDIKAAQKLFSDWPTPIVASGFEVGVKLRFPQSSVDRHFNYFPRHPVRETYNYVTRAFRPHDHWTWDLTSVLIAARSDEGYFDFSKSGRIEVLDDGSSKFVEYPGGRHRYLILNNAQKDRVLEAMIMLVTQPPLRRSHAAKGR